MATFFIPRDSFMREGYPETKTRDGLHVSDIAAHPQDNRIGLKPVFQATFNSKSGMPEDRERIPTPPLLPAPPARRRKRTK